jgi:hypothetical protein
MKTVPRVLVAAALALASGCARSDWIQQTLVTVDVTGTWQSTDGSSVRLDLKQEGARVKGSIETRGPQFGGLSVAGPIEGTVQGDEFHFRMTSGVLLGKTTVSGDEMTGRVGSNPGAATGGRNIILRRIDSSESAPSEQR